MKIAVFGGSGFLGVHCVAALGARGHEVLVLSRGDRRRAGAPFGARRRGCDATSPIDPGLLEGCDAIVNLIGIKRERGRNTFERAHVDAVHNILRAARAAGVRRLVHVGVCASRPDEDPYLDSKHRGEQAVVGSGLDFTVLRPGIVYGSGDDVLHRLIASVRHAALFPVPAGGSARLALVDVRDVARAIVTCLERADTVGASLDLAADPPMALRDLVGHVARVLALPTRVLSVPAPLMRLAAAGMELALADPPVTRAQLGMLARGVAADPGPARERLGLLATALDDERIREIAAEPRNARPAFGISLRAVWSDAQREQLARVASAFDPVRALVLGIGVLALAGLAVTNPWFALAAAYALLLLVLVPVRGLPWRTLWRRDAGSVMAGLTGALASWGAAVLGVAALASFAPELVEQIDEVHGWAHRIGAVPALALLVLIVVAEDVYWRVGIGFALAHRIGPWTGIGVAGLGFALAHLTLGPPILWLAAFACGAFWTWLAIRTRSLTAPFVAHLTWDIVVLWVAPLA